MVHTRSYRLIRALVLSMLDGSAWFAALAAATATRMAIAEAPVRWPDLLGLAAVAGGTQMVVGSIGRLRHRTARTGELDDLTPMFGAWAVASAATAAADLAVFSTRPAPVLALAAAVPSALVTMFGVRFARRFLADVTRHLRDTRVTHRVIVVGAGDTGEQLVRTMMHGADSPYVPVAIVDDDPSTHDRQLRGVRVHGTVDELARVAQITAADLVVVADRDSDLLARVDAAACMIGLDTHVFDTTDPDTRRTNLADIRPLDAVDLLGTDDGEVDLATVAACVSNKRVVVAGTEHPIGALLGRLLARIDVAALAAVGTSAALEAINATQPDVVLSVGATPDDALSDQLMGSVRAGTTVFANICPDRISDAASDDGRARSDGERLTTEMDEVADGRFFSVRFGTPDGHSTALSDFEASRLILQALADAEGGEVVVVDHSKATKTHRPGPTDEERRTARAERRAARAGGRRHDDRPVIKADALIRAVEEQAAPVLRPRIRIPSDT